MALFGGGNNGATISYGQTAQYSSDGTVINDAGEIYVNFKIPCFSNASDVMPMQTLTDAQVGLDADDTLYLYDEVIFLQKAELFISIMN